MIKIFENSMKELKNLSKIDENLTQHDWDLYANQNGYFTSFKLTSETKCTDFRKLKKLSKWY